MIEIDIHGMLFEQAKHIIEEAIKNAPKGTEGIRVIHGYHRGDKLQQMVRDPNIIRHKRLWRRKLTKNPGETIMLLYV